jgi:hypothetical protein
MLAASSTAPLEARRNCVCVSWLDSHSWIWAQIFARKIPFLTESSLGFITALFKEQKLFDCNV